MKEDDETSFCSKVSLETSPLIRLGMMDLDSKTPGKQVPLINIMMLKTLTLGFKAVYKFLNPYWCVHHVRDRVVNVLTTYKFGLFRYVYLE
jgi:hypothetical protein